MALFSDPGFQTKIFYFKIINIFDFFQSDFLGIGTKSGEEGLVSPKCLRNIGVCVFLCIYYTTCLGKL